MYGHTTLMGWRAAGIDTSCSVPVAVLSVTVPWHTGPDTNVEPEAITSLAAVISSQA